MMISLLVKNTFSAQEASLPHLMSTGHLDPLSLAYPTKPI